MREVLSEAVNKAFEKMAGLDFDRFNKWKLERHFTESVDFELGTMVGMIFRDPWKRYRLESVTVVFGDNSSDDEAERDKLMADWLVREGYLGRPS